MHLPQPPPPTPRCAAWAARVVIVPHARADPGRESKKEAGRTSVVCPTCGAPLPHPFREGASSPLIIAFSAGWSPRPSSPPVLYAASCRRGARKEGSGRIQNSRSAAGRGVAKPARSTPYRKPHPAVDMPHPAAALRTPSASAARPVILSAYRAQPERASCRIREPGRAWSRAWSGKEDRGHPAHHHHRRVSCRRRRRHRPCIDPSRSDSWSSSPPLSPWTVRRWVAIRRRGDFHPDPTPAFHRDVRK